MLCMNTFANIEQILQKNNTYYEEHKKQEEHARIQREPIGDLQSPMDNARWKTLYKELFDAKIKYNIGKMNNDEIVNDKKELVEGRNKLHQLFLQKILISTEKPSFLQKLCFCNNNNNNMQLEKYDKEHIQHIQYLIDEIDRHLPYYELFLVK